MDDLTPRRARRQGAANGPFADAPPQAWLTDPTVPLVEKLKAIGAVRIRVVQDRSEELPSPSDGASSAAGISEDRAMQAAPAASPLHDYSPVQLSLFETIGDDERVPV